MLLLSLAGCGSKSLLDPRDPVELTFWHVYGEQADSPMDQLVDEFNRTVGRENGVRVKVTAQSSASRIGALLLESQAGSSDTEMPDLFTCHLNNALELGADNLIDWKEWFSAEELGQFVPGFLADGEADGRLLVFPVSKSTHVLMFNGSRFARFSADTGYMPVRTGAFDGIDLSTYQFPEESYVALYAALKDMQEQYTAVSESNFAGYYDGIYTLYGGLRRLQNELPARAAAGEDVEALAEETWDFFRSIR